MEDASRAVAFAADADAFCAEVGRALEPEAQAASGERRQAVAPYSWDGLFDRLDAECAAALTP